MRNQVRQAINSNLSGMALSPQTKQKIWADIEGGQQHMKRKLPLALVIAITLVLLTAAALAAVILGGKDVVEQVIAPKAQQTDSNRFTKEEVEEILAFAEKHGIVLEDVYLKRIREEGTYFKDELALLFAKDQLGFYPSTWDVEDQYWYAALRHRLDPESVMDAALPEEGELSQQEIEEKAARHVQMHHGKELEPLNKERYRINRSFRATRVNPWYVERVWHISFEPLYVEGAYFRLKLSPQGEVTDFFTDHDMLHNGTTEVKAQLLMNRFHSLYGNIYGSQDAWSQENWQDLKERLKHLNPDPASMTEVGYILQQDYRLPQGAITREEAVQIAARAVGEKYKASASELLNTEKGKMPAESMVYAIYLGAKGQQHWKISFDRDYLAEVDALTGQVKVVDVYSPGNDYYRRYTLDVLIPEEKKAFATPRPLLDETEEDLDKLAESQQFFPENLEVAPPYFWEQLQAIGYNVKTAAGIFSMLYDTYGLEDRFWPILYQAMYNQKEFRPAPGEMMPGLPAPEDLQQEEAVQKARQALTDLNQEGRYQADYLDNLKPVVLFTFNLYEPGSRTWQIDFLDITQDPRGEDRAYVKVDAKTGQVIDALFVDSRFEDATPITEAWSDMGEDGRPSVWGHPNAPKSYWDYMEKHYNSREAVEQAIAAWQEEHGDNPNFWPPEADAVMSLWRYSFLPDQGEPDPELVAIPGPDEMSLEQVEEIAWEKMREATKDKYSQEDYDSLRIKSLLRYDKRGSRGTVWQIEFADSRTNYTTSLTDMDLDGHTGEVLFITTDISQG